MKRVLAIGWFWLLAFCTPVFAQVGGGVTFIPPITANHCAKWQAYNILADAGANCGSGSGSVTSLSNSDGTLTLTPNPITTTGTVSLALGHVNTWSGSQTFSGGATVTGSFTATGLVTNADLTNASTTVNGQACTLGSACTVTASATSVTVGTTTVGGGATTNILYNNAGTLGEYTVSGTGTIVALAASPSLTGTPSATSLAITGTAGAGFIELPPQSVAPATPAANTVRLYSSTAGVMRFLYNSGFTIGLSGASLTASRNLTAPDISSTIAVTANNLGVFASGGAIAPATGTFGGGSIGSDVLEATGSTTLNGAVAVVSAPFGLSGNISAPTWTTNGVRYKNVAVTLTDTTAATGTTATAYTDVWGGNTIAATNSGVIYTLYAGSNFKVPVAGTNVTLTNAFAIAADSISVNSGSSSSVFKLSVGSGNVGVTGGYVAAQALRDATATSAIDLTSAGFVDIVSGRQLRGASTTDASASSGSGALQIAGGGSIAKRFWLPGISTSAGLQTTVLCGGATGEVIADSVACLASSGRFKERMQNIPASEALTEVLSLVPKSFYYTKKFNGRFQADPNYNGQFVGFKAEDVSKVDPRLVTWDEHTGKGVTPHGVRYENLTALLAGAIKAQQSEIVALRAANNNLAQRLAKLEHRH